MADSRVYLVTVTGEGPVNGGTVRVVLGTRQVVSPQRALRWLRAQARRIADGLDPDPCAVWVPRAALVPVRTGAPGGPGVLDGPAALRWWTDDPGEQETARNRLASGTPYAFTTTDTTGRYTLTAVPMPVPPPNPTPAPRPGSNRHRKPRRWEWRWGNPFRRRAPERARARVPATATATAVAAGSPRTPQHST
ncbi:hypothetical protein ACIOEX_24870 [Streptomyces sp. NPDC087850]|uniref:hypothetical protein n=1 Tax=Streptomyces sp. NPDC087850 TaxID=3365809 RepID=UPI0038291E7C